MEELFERDQLASLDDFHIRDEGTEWIVSGTAVPYNQIIHVREYNKETGQWEEYEEQFARDSVVVPPEGAFLYRAHDRLNPIGKLMKSKHTPQGWKVTAKIFKTTAGADARTELLEGALKGFSIGAKKSTVQSIHDQPRNLFTRIKAIVDDVSLALNPFYPGATIDYARDQAAQPQGEPMTVPTPDPTPAPTPAPDPTPAPTPDANLLTRDQFSQEIQRLESGIDERLNRDRKPVKRRDARTAGAFLKALVSGDQKTLDHYTEYIERSKDDQAVAEMHEAYLERAFPTDGVLSDSIVLDAWVGDVIRTVDQAAILKNVFTVDAIAETGMNQEYGKNKTAMADAAIAEQTNQGDNLAFGSAEIEIDTVPIKTFGGYTQLSRQVIERSSVPYLDFVLREQARVAGKRQNTIIRNEFVATYNANVTDSYVVEAGAATSYKGFVDALIDGAEIFQDEGFSMDALVADKGAFKALMNLEGSDGRPMLLIDGNGVNNVGTLNPTGLSGQFAGLRVVCDPKISNDPSGDPVNSLAIVNKAGLTFWQSPIARLQDSNIVNLSELFSLYFYGAVASQLPKAILPIEFTPGS